MEKNHHHTLIVTIKTKTNKKSEKMTQMPINKGMVI